MAGQSQVLIVFVVLLIGIFLGAGVTGWIMASRKSNAENPAPVSAVDEMAALRAQYAETAGLWHEKTSGKLVLRFENQMIKQVQQLTPEQRARLESLTKEWLGWWGSAQPEIPQTSPVVLEKSTLPVQPPVPVVPPVMLAVTPASAAPVKPQSMVEQIDDILQERLVHSGASQKGVRLVEDPTRGVVVWIGLERYEGVDSVTDPEVRALLREAVGEWERRATLARK